MSTPWPLLFAMAPLSSLSTRSSSPSASVLSASLSSLSATGAGTEETEETEKGREVGTGLGTDTKHGIGEEDGTAAIDDASTNGNSTGPSGNTGNTNEWDPRPEIRRKLCEALPAGLTAHAVLHAKVRRSNTTCVHAKLLCPAGRFMIHQVRRRAEREEWGREEYDEKREAKEKDDERTSVF